MKRYNFLIPNHNLNLGWMCGLFALATGCAAQSAPATSNGSSSASPRLAQNPLPISAEKVPLSKPAADAPFPGIALAPVPDELLNKWPTAEEAAFQARAHEVLAVFDQKIKTGNYGSTYFENEKKSYPYAMLDFLNGKREPALKYLQSNDADAKSWNVITQGIDFYPAFTLKGQGRKYFLFGPYLDPAYKARMFEGARLWTEQDPLKRRNPFFKKGGDGWTPASKNSWVDVRGTDNLRAMREVNAYLFAEETGNTATRDIYKQRIAAYAARLYSTGLGEWDSENYLGHTTASFLNLYDFAKDEKVRAQAKAALDWLMITAALKYRHGGWAAPTKRDYGGASRVYGSLSARFFQIYFGDGPPDPEPEPDVVHAITSRYRPPLTALAIARKEFEPTEMFEAKPNYNKWGAGEPPEYWETMFYGKTFQMGSIASRGSDNDMSPFKLVTDNSVIGVNFFVANTLPVTGHQGKNKGDQIGQNRNLLVWLRPAGSKVFEFLAPKNANFEQENGIWFWKMEKTWLALRPINLGDPKTSEITKEVKKKKQPTQIVPDEDYADAQVFSAHSTGDSYVGFALEVGEGGDFVTWKNSVKARGALDLTSLKEGTAKLTGSDGHTLRVDFNKTDDLPLVARDGVERKWTQETAVYAPRQGALVSQDWGGGTLRAQAGGHVYQASVSREGEVTWSEK